MEPTGSIDRQPWMTANSTRRVLAALTADGAEVRFVGGCVRDAVLGWPVRDVDIATHDRPEAVIELLKRAGLKAVPTGIDHGTVTAVVAGDHFEITTLRLDVETYGRHAKVAFTDDWVADAARRDFTINALSASPDGALFDPFGGCADLRDRRVRFVGDARERIREDVLRLLRFFRFHAYYGEPPPDPEALQACSEMAPHLKSLSAERVRAELLRLMLAANPAAVLKLMAESGILAHILPEAERFDRLQALVDREASIEIDGDAIRRLAAVLTVDADTAVIVAERLRLANAERDRLAGLAATPDGLALGDGDAPQRRALYRLGAARYRDLALLAAADDPLQDVALLRQRLTAAEHWQRPNLPVAGTDVKKLGAAPGPKVGQVLAAVEDWWLEGDFRADRAACLVKLEEFVDAFD